MLLLTMLPVMFLVCLGVFVCLFVFGGKKKTYKVVVSARLKKASVPTSWRCIHGHCSLPCRYIYLFNILQ